MSDPDPAELSFIRQGRSLPTLVAVLIAFGVGLWAVFILSVAFWIVGLLALFTLPALWDLIHSTTAGTEIVGKEIRWHSGAREGSVDLSEVDHVRLVTRLDLSVRAALVLKTGRKIRLPAEATPPHQQLEKALKARGIRTERHHFTIL